MQNMEFEAETKNGIIYLSEGVAEEFGSIDIPCYNICNVKSRLINILMHDLNLGRGESKVISS